MHLQHYVVVPALLMGMGLAIKTAFEFRTLRKEKICNSQWFDIFVQYVAKIQSRLVLYIVKMYPKIIV